MTARRSPYLVSGFYDWTFFLLPPLVGTVLGLLIVGTPITTGAFVVNGSPTTLAAVFIGALTHAHLVAVAYRSHLNPQVFARYRWRFLAVPLVLWIAIAGSTYVAVTATVVATFWDVWHSGAQTFGFARIYDRNAGNAPEVGRRLDFWLAQLLYAGPILAGATLIDHLESFDNFEAVGSVFFTEVPERVMGWQAVLTWTVIVGGTLFVAVYVLTQLALRQRGYRISLHKVFLVGSTGLCSIYAWGFNPWGQAFFIMNFFHAVQYLALVWAKEQKTIATRLRLARRWAIAAAFFGPVVLYGIGAELLDPDVTWLWAATMVVSLMHFWYDGFIWSVRANQV